MKLLDDLDWKTCAYRVEIENGSVWKHGDDLYTIYSYARSKHPGRWQNIDKFTAQCVLNYLLEGYNNIT